MELHPSVISRHKYLIKSGFAGADRETEDADPMGIDDEEIRFNDDAVEFGYVLVVRFLLELCHLRYSARVMSGARFMNMFDGF